MGRVSPDPGRQPVPAFVPSRGNARDVAIVCAERRTGRWSSHRGSRRPCSSGIAPSRPCGPPASPPHARGTGDGPNRAESARARGDVAGAGSRSGSQPGGPPSSGPRSNEPGSRHRAGIRCGGAGCGGVGVRTAGKPTTRNAGSRTTWDAPRQTMDSINGTIPVSTTSLPDQPRPPRRPGLPARRHTAHSFMRDSCSTVILY